MSWRNTTLTIASGATESEELNLYDVGGPPKAKVFTFFIPNISTEVIRVYFAPAVGGTYASLNDSYGNIYQLQSEQSQILPGVTAGGMKLVATAAVAADRVITLRGAFDA